MRQDWNGKNSKKYIVLILAALAFIICVWNASDPLQKGIADKILRFHILANSDSDEDQEVKKKVRDQVGQMMAPLLEDASGLAETQEIVAAHMDEIVCTAEETLRAEGYTYGASARLARVSFPVKTYGDYTFPAGEYEALEITLGEGKGHNWWCVLYPNMCFQGTVYEVVEESADEALREVLTPAEYADVFDSGNFEIRFRFLELLKGKKDDKRSNY